jgi:uncharacterized protein YbjQ (UPF0145 family)
VAQPQHPQAHVRQYVHDLPQHARERIEEMRQHHFFTSDLSVNEFLLVKEAGFHPLGLVMGSSIFHVGFQPIRGVSEELSTLTQALYHARELAMVRMEEEADALGADGIVAVRLTVNVHAWGTNVIEFVAIGTAVKAERSQGWRVGDKPFTSDLSGQDFWTLLSAGYRPVGFVMGNCVYYIGQQAAYMQQAPGYAQAQQGYANQPTENMELTGPTQALYDSRELAMERMQVEAEALEAEGIVGVTVEETNHTWGPSILEFSAVGTAVVAMRADHQIPRPSLVLTVND